MTDQHASRGRPATTDDDIDLQRLFALLIDAKWLILGSTLLALLLGGLYAKFATPIYKADALLQVEKKQGLWPGLRSSLWPWARSNPWRRRSLSSAHAWCSAMWSSSCIPILWFARIVTPGWAALPPRNR